MVQATTPTFVLTLLNTVDLGDAEHVYFTLEQDYVRITKDESDMTINSNVVSVYLSQNDTVNLTKNFPIKVQLNWTYADGSRAASEVKTEEVSENLLKDVVE